MQETENIPSETELAAPTRQTAGQDKGLGSDKDKQGPALTEPPHLAGKTGTKHDIPGARAANVRHPHTGWAVRGLLGVCGGKAEQASTGGRGQESHPGGQRAQARLQAAEGQTKVEPQVAAG